MKPTSTRRGRRRQDVGHQQEQKKEQKFFGGETHMPFFQPGATLSRAPEGGEEKKEEKISKSPEEKKEEEVQRAAAPEEEKKEEKVSKAPEDKKEEEKEAVSRAPADPKEEKEEKASRAPDPKEEQKEKKIEKKGEAGGAGESTVRYVEGIKGKGQPMSTTELNFFGDRMGYDFSAVRIHTGKEAADSARDARAKAYTYGNHVVFSEGRYNPGTHEGKQLLAHELAHVVQKNGGAGSGKDQGSGKGGNGSGRTQEAAPRPSRAPTPASLHRKQESGTGAAAPTPTDRALFNNRLSRALAQMTTPMVVRETLGGTLEPVLRDMADNATWIDMNGTETAGAEVSVQLPRGGRTVRLRLILDDSLNPPLSGTFNSAGADLGIIRVSTRENDDPDTLATTLYHESLHLMRWLARSAPGGDFIAETGATGGRRRTLEGIDPSRQPQHMAQVRRRIEGIASSVNASRLSSDQVGSTGIDRVTEFIMEEYLTRIETEVFRLMRDSDAVSPTMRPGVATVRGGTLVDRLFPRPDVDKYLFEINSVFRVADRDSLQSFDRVMIDSLYEYFRDRVEMFVRRRYSEVIHGPGF